MNEHAIQEQTLTDPRVFSESGFKGWFVSTLLLAAWAGSLINGPITVIKEPAQAASNRVDTNQPLKPLSEKTRGYRAPKDLVCVDPVACSLGWFLDQWTYYRSDWPKDVHQSGCSFQKRHEDIEPQRTPW
jgi:hypothetical protein